MVISELVHETAEQLRGAEIENYIFEAHLIVRTILKKTPIDLVLEKAAEASPKAVREVREAVERRKRHEPLQYILKSQEFMSLEFYVDKNVLIPRQDTEVLVEAVLQKKPGSRVTALDIGTGSGCIAVSIAHYNKNALVRAIDISESALKIARKNAVLNNTAERIVFEKKDIMREELFGKFDIIVSNPPYIESAAIADLQPEVRDYEPHSALDGGKSGLDFYKRIVSVSAECINRGGIIALEVGIGQAETVAQMLSDSFGRVEIIKDLCGVDRVVTAEAI